MKIYSLFIPLLFIVHYASLGQVIQVEFENSSHDGKIKNHSSLFLTEEKAQFIHDFDGKTIQIEEITVDQEPNHYIINYYPKEKKVKEFRTFKNHLFTSAWNYDDDWTITEESDTILNLPVIKAYKTEDPDFGKTFVWFTTQIPIPAGPYRYSGLPGLILKITYEKDDTTITATQIEELPEHHFIKFNEENVIPMDREDIKWFDEKNAKKKIKRFKK